MPEDTMDWRARSWSSSKAAAVTLAWVTRLPGPGVGPIPSTGLISLQPDVYLLAVVLIVAVAWRVLMARDPGR